MLREEPLAPTRRPATPARRLTPAVAALLTLVAAAVIALRHDYWWWNSPEPLLFGVLPAGLWWQAVVSILASLMMWLMVTLAWPAALEQEAIEAEQRRLAASRGAGDRDRAVMTPASGNGDGLEARGRP